MLTPSTPARGRLAGLVRGPHFCLAAGRQCAKRDNLARLRHASEHGRRHERGGARRAIPVRRRRLRHRPPLLQGTPSNTGTHIGNLWTNSGTLLATATFTGETAIGLAAGDASPRRSPSPPAPPTSRRTTRPPGTTRASDRYFATTGVDQRAAARARRRRRRRERRLPLRRERASRIRPISGQLLGRRGVHHDRAAPTSRRRPSRHAASGATGQHQRRASPRRSARC